MAQAQSLITVGRHAEAIQLLRSAVSSDPQNADLLCWLGFAFLRAGHPAEALRAGQSAGALAPEYEWPYRIVADALISLRKPKQALAAAQEALRLDPMSAAVVQINAEAQLASGKPAEADATGARLIELEPEYAGGFDIRGRAALKRKQFREAEAHFREALRLEPGSWAMNNNLGVALLGQKKKKEAVEAFERAVKADPKANLARRNLFGATRAYVGAGSLILVYFVLVRLVPIAGNAAHLPSWAVVLIFLGAIGTVALSYWLIGRRRRSQLSASVYHFYERELARERKINALHAVFKVGPLLAMAIGLLALGIAQSPGLFLAMVAAILVTVVWIVVSPRLWRHTILPRLRPYDQASE